MAPLESAHRHFSQLLERVTATVWRKERKEGGRRREGGVRKRGAMTEKCIEQPELCGYVNRFLYGRKRVNDEIKA